MAWRQKWSTSSAMPCDGLAVSGTHVLIYGVRADDGTGYVYALSSDTGALVDELNLGARQVRSAVSRSGSCYAVVAASGEAGQLVRLSVADSAVVSQTLASNLPTTSQRVEIQAFAISGDAFDLYIECDYSIFADVTILGTRRIRTTGSGSTVATYVTDDASAVRNITSLRHENGEIYALGDDRVLHIVRDGDGFDVRRIDARYPSLYGPEAPVLDSRPAGAGNWGWSLNGAAVLTGGTVRRPTSPLGPGETWRNIVVTQEPGALAAVATVVMAGQTANSSRVLTMNASGVFSELVAAAGDGMVADAFAWLGSRSLVMARRRPFVGLSPQTKIERFENPAVQDLRLGPRRSQASFRGF